MKHQVSHAKSARTAAPETLRLDRVLRDARQTAIPELEDRPDEEGVVIAPGEVPKVCDEMRSRQRLLFERRVALLSISAKGALKERHLRVLFVCVSSLQCISVNCA